MNLTIRNIPDNVINKIRTVSRMEKRSLNNQINIWKRLSKELQDDRSTDEIINDICLKASYLI